MSDKANKNEKNSPESFFSQEKHVDITKKQNQFLTLYFYIYFLINMKSFRDTGGIYQLLAP